MLRSDGDIAPVIDTLCALVLPLHFPGLHYREEGIADIKIACRNEGNTTIYKPVLCASSQGSLVEDFDINATIKYIVSASASTALLPVPNVETLPCLYGQVLCYRQVNILQ